MNKTVLIACVLASICFSQTAIPFPPDIPGASSQSIIFLKAIGDYDGDGTNDVFVVWGLEYAAVAYCIYSYSKQAYLLEVPGSGIGLTAAGMPTWDAADINNDKKVELILGRAIYSYNSSQVKKKY
jgi:hypothetical protein